MLARDHAGRLSIREAAEKCGLNYRTWATWETGAASRTKVEDAQIIAEVLGVDLDWLLYGGPLPAPARPARKHRVAYARRSVRPGARRPRRIGRARTSVAA